jgi:hypothetical protein
MTGAEGIMLRVLSWLFFVVGILEVVLILIHKLDLGMGLPAICFAVFFGGLFHGLATIERHVRALRDHFMRADQGTSHT